MITFSKPYDTSVKLYNVNHNNKLLYERGASMDMWQSVYEY